MGQLITRTGRVNIFPQLGLAIATLAFIMLSVLVSRAPTIAVLGITVLVGVGLGMVMPPTQVSVQLAAGRESLGVATASISLSRSIGGALGVAVTGAVLFATLGDSGGFLSALLQEVIEGGSTSIGGLSVDQRAQLVTHLDAAYRVAFALLALITGAGVILASTVPKPDWARHG